MSKAKVMVLDSYNIDIEIEEKSQDNKLDELLGDLNPRYFEELIKLDNAKDNIYSNLANMFNFSIVY